MLEGLWINCQRYVVFFVSLVHSLVEYVSDAYSFHEHWEIL